MKMGGPGEVPGTVWLGPARWYGGGRDGCQVAFVVLHYTAGAEGRTAAENGAAYDRRRADQVSTHFFTDSDSIVQEVLLADRAYAAFGNGNRLGVQIEICGTLQTRDQWMDATSTATLINTARLTAELCTRYGLEPRRLTHTEMRAAWAVRGKGNSPRGIVGHVDCTQAYGQGDHTDPGTAFPWDYFIGLVRQMMRQSTSDQDPKGVDDDMAKVFAVNNGNGIDYYGWTGGHYVSIVDGPTLVAFRQLAVASVGGTASQAQLENGQGIDAPLALSALQATNAAGVPIVRADGKTVTPDWATGG